MSEPIMQFFQYAHLPPHLQEVSKPFGDLAEQLVAKLPRNAERATALRKLLEGKDAAVRALLFKGEPVTSRPEPTATVVAPPDHTANLNP